MAKSWKSFVKKDENLSGDPEGSQELSGIGKELNISLEELAKSNDQLRAILEQRDALEEKMRQLTNPSATPNPQGPRFGSEIDSITRKRREDQERFEARQKLEEKLRLKKEELNAWTKKIKRIRDKVTRTKEEFDRKMDELHRTKKKVDEFVKVLRKKPSDDFDYEKLSGPLKKAVGDFPFTERMRDRTDEVFNKPVGQIIEKITEREPVKKIVDTWEEIKEKKREAAKIKEQFERAIRKKEELKGKFDDFASKLNDTFGNEDPEKSFEEDDGDEPAEKKVQEQKKKQSIFERLKERRKRKQEEGKEKKKKKKGFSTDDLDDALREFGREEEETEPEEKERDEEKNEEEDALERRDEQRRKRREERRAERKESRRNDRFGIDPIEPAVEEENEAADDADTDEAAMQKKKEREEEERKQREEEERKESQKQEKLRERMAQRRAQKREEERHEKRKRVKDKFD